MGAHTTTKVDYTVREYSYPLENIKLLIRLSVRGIFTQRSVRNFDACSGRVLPLTATQSAV